MEVIFVIFEKKKCKLIWQLFLYKHFCDIFFDIVATNDKWSWSIYFEFSLASFLIPKNKLSACSNRKSRHVKFTMICLHSCRKLSNTLRNLSPYEMLLINIRTGRLQHWKETIKIDCRVGHMIYYEQFSQTCKIFKIQLMLFLSLVNNGP